MDNDKTFLDQSDSLKKELSNYPYYPLSSALKIGEAVRDLGGSNAGVQKSVLASHLGESEKSPGLQQRVASAKCFGIIDGRGTFSLTEAGRSYFLPTSESERSTALLTFLTSPAAFSAIIRRFDGAKLPSRDILANVFHREGKVPDSWKERMASFFSSSAELAGALDSNGFLRLRAIKERGLSKSQREVNVASVEPDTKVASALNSTSQFGSGTEHNVWDFSFHGKSVRLITPTELDKDLWEKLEAYVQLLKPPEKSDTRMADSQRDQS